MKKYTLILLFVISSISYAQTKIITKATVTNVNLYSNSAELKNTTKVSLQKGVNEIVVSNISDAIREKSIQISINDKNVTVLSTQFVDDYEYICHVLK